MTFHISRWIVTVYAPHVYLSVTRKGGAPLQVSDYFILGSLLSSCFAAEVLCGVSAYRSLVKRCYPEDG